MDASDLLFPIHTPIGKSVDRDYLKRQLILNQATDKMQNSIITLDEWFDELADYGIDPYACIEGMTDLLKHELDS